MTNLGHDLSGRVALVTGASGGIGRATALKFAAHGARVAVADITSGIEETADMIEKAGGEAIAITVDVSDSKSVESMVKTTVDHFGRLDCAHNNAGIFIPAPLADLEDADFEKVIAVNLNGVFYAMKYEIRQMLTQGGGAIVNTGSLWSNVGAPAQAAYVASKHGVLGLTRNGAADYGTQGIRVNAVGPGPIRTNMTAAVPDEIMATIVGRSQMQRMGEPEEVADVVVWLCSDAASYVTGVIVGVDGGWLSA